MWYDQTVLIGCMLTLMQLVQKTPLLSQAIAVKGTAANYSADYTMPPSYRVLLLRALMLSCGQSGKYRITSC